MSQYYLPDLDAADESHLPKFKLEYLTYALDALHPPVGVVENEALNPPVGVEDKFHYPVPVRHLPKALRKEGVEASKYAPYGMEDLTIGSWVELAHVLGNKKNKKIRERYERYMYMDGGRKSGLMGKGHQDRGSDGEV